MYSERIESCGTRITKALTIRAMRQADLAEITKIPKSSLSLYLKGSYEPKGDRIYIIAQALRVSEAWLMGYDVPMEREDEKIPGEPKLTEAEQKMLELFRRIPVERQESALEVLEVLLKMQQIL